MSGTLSTRWFWSDWMSDPGLRACSYAARGLWKDMLCIAGANKAEYGFVSLNGQKLEAAGIARMTNGTPEEVGPLLDELQRNGVFNRDRRGVIYCRRMVRAEKSRSNGRLGGNPNLKNNKAKPDQVKPDPKPLIPKPEPKPVPKGTQTPSGGLSDEGAKSDWPKDHREQFWSTYPRKTEKQAAMSKLDAIRKSRTVPWAVLFAGVMRYAAHVVGTEHRYIKHPTTWLNRGCWDDELGPPRGPDHQRPSRNGRAALALSLMNEEEEI